MADMNKTQLLAKCAEMGLTAEESMTNKVLADMIIAAGGSAEAPKPPKAVTFNSRYNSIRIQIKPSRVDIIDGYRVITPGVVARFTNGAFTTTDEEIIDRLRKHPAYKRDFFELKV